ncbi:MAG: helix-turn-helix transcriptional regulator [Armatimonadetes bacterium]|nr:helix-turn-helix transcriptional regulator [Armatimonadota bacterium]
MPVMSRVEKVIGHKINEIRHRSHLTQIEFAEEIDVHPSYIGPMEKGRKCPSFHTLLRIASRFTIPVYEFFLETEAAMENPTLELNLLLSSRPREEQTMVIELAHSLFKNMEKKPKK